MPIPGVGFQEVVIILIAALMIFGPAKLPELMGQAGKALRDFRKMTGNLQGEFEKNLNEAAGTDVRKTLSSEIAGLRNEVQSAADSISGKPAAKTTTARPVTSVAKAVTPAAGKTTTTAAAKKTTVGSTVAASTGTTGGAAVLESDAEASGEIEFVPVRTTSRRGSGTTSTRSAAAAPRPESTPSPASSGTATVSRPRPAGTGISGADLEASDPFVRARSRRQAAGYHR
jgi:sec-independent protein translocase protein TatA